ncbi:hypothetical protein LENED_006495 [Lentinula edodes]|uniref:Uncharacterized protein n=1 Tax=Lentinula edodes TaxID=5353 RepID=A0A1Q3EC19_LENED|nr:hypothetical protein LENED_006495 [Lentinula edodes]
MTVFYVCLNYTRVTLRLHSRQIHAILIQPPYAGRRHIQIAVRASQRLPGTVWYIVIRSSIPRTKVYPAFPHG